MAHPVWTWPGWKQAEPDTRVRHNRSGRTGTLRKVVLGRTGGSRFAVIQWDHDTLGRHVGEGEGVTGRVVAPARDLTPITEESDDR